MSLAPKIDELKTFLLTEESTTDIICITETRLCERISNIVNLQRPVVQSSRLI